MCTFELVGASISWMHREVCPTSPSENSLRTNANVGRIAPRVLLARTLCDGVRLHMISVGRVEDHALRVLDAVKIPNPNTRKDLRNN